MFRKILLGVGVASVALIVLAVSLSGGESMTDTPTSPAPAATEAPAVVPEPIEAPVVESEPCHLTASCLLTNGWTAARWDSDVAALTPSLEAQYGGLAALAAGCMVDVVMTVMSPNEFDGLSDAEYETLGANLLHQCRMGEIRVP